MSDSKKPAADTPSPAADPAAKAAPMASLVALFSISIKPGTLIAPGAAFQVPQDEADRLVAGGFARLADPVPEPPVA